MHNHTKHIFSDLSDVRPANPQGAVQAEVVREEPEYVPQVFRSEAHFGTQDFFPSATDRYIIVPSTEYAASDPRESSTHRFSWTEQVSRFLKPMKWLGLFLLLIALIVGGKELFTQKGEVLGESETGYQNLSLATKSLQAGNVLQSDQDFVTAYQSFSSAWDHLGVWQFKAVDALRYIPFLSKVSSGKNIIEAGKHISRAGHLLNGSFSALSPSGNPLSKDGVSFLDMLDASRRPLEQALPELESAQESLSGVVSRDIPEDKRATFEKAQTTLPIVIGAAKSFLEKRGFLADALGGNGPRKYLFLFQNNHELRPTGGFIGSYGILDMKDGRIRKFFVDGVFNPDGQLKEKIIPPTPLQKVSVAWSFHDSNWSPDFPTAAQKAMYFYEKTGGPTVDGVIALTPDIIRDLVGLFGPIEMKEYGVTLDENNFVEAVQEEVEVKYDREANQPKKIIADLAPILLDRIFSTRDPKKLFATLELLTDHLNRRNILLYAKNADVEANIDALGWSGRVMDTPMDYLSVINTNINGYKTDAVVRESISHTAEIRKDGSVVDTARITRRHEGGKSKFEWWNKVNADYMRVYVPEGSELLSVTGQTREVVPPPVDYRSLGFIADPDITKEEQSIRIDERSGTRVGADLGKTTFGNWVYVSPGESVTIEYEYRLPFHISESDYATYSMLFQKQSGSLGSAVKSTISPPDVYQLEWQTGEYQRKNSVLSFESILEKNIFLGAAWRIPLKESTE